MEMDRGGKMEMERGGNKRSIDHYVLGKTLVRMLAYADVC
jgi:hypothetical protein